MSLESKSKHFILVPGLEELFDKTLIHLWLINKTELFKYLDNFPLTNIQRQYIDIKTFPELQVIALGEQAKEVFDFSKHQQMKIVKKNIKRV